MVLLFVDVEKVVLESPDGRRVAVALEAQQKKIDAELDAKEREIAAVRKKLERDPRARAEYQSKAGEYDALVTAKQAELERAQDAAFQPILDRVEAVMQTVAAEGVRLADIADHPPLFPSSACDATGAIAAMIASGARPSIGPRDGCGAKAFFYVELDRVMRALPEAKRATARLDAFQRERQTELDQRSRQIETAGGADVEARRLELADRYAAYRRELKEREEKESAAMRALALKKVSAQKDRYPGAVWLEKIAEVEPIARSCDVTRFFAGDDPRGLALACPAYTEKGSN